MSADFESCCDAAIATCVLDQYKRCLAVAHIRG